MLDVDNYRKYIYYPSQIFRNTALFSKVWENNEINKIMSALLPCHKEDDFNARLVLPDRKVGILHFEKVLTQASLTVKQSKRSVLTLQSQFGIQTKDVSVQISKWQDGSFPIITPGQQETVVGLA